MKKIEFGFFVVFLAIISLAVLGCGGGGTISTTTTTTTSSASTTSTTLLSGSWHALGTGMGSTVLSLAVDGSNNLFAGGWFTSAGSANALRVAKWNGSAWSTLGFGMNGNVYALEYGLRCKQ